MAAVVAQASCSSSSSGLGVGSIPGLSAQNFQRFSSSRGNSASNSLICFHKGNFSLLCESRAWPRRVHVECRCSRGENPENPEGNFPSDSENADSWERRIESILLGVRGPLLQFLSHAGRKVQRYLQEARSIKSPEVVEEVEVPKLDSEWDRWQSVFHNVEEQENLLAVLKFDLEEAIDQEDYIRASRIKKEMTEIRSNFAAAQLMDELKIALNEERYDDASRIRDETSAGLVGWWAGAAEEGNDPFGRIINITSTQGRLVARGFSAKQLVQSGPGVPLFEIYFRKTEDNDYESQAVYLQRERTDSSASAASSDEKSDESEADEKLQDESIKPDDEKAPESLKDASKDSLDEGLNRIFNFLKGRMPDVKLKVFQPDKAENELPKIGDQLKPSEESSKKDEELVGSSSDDGKAPLDNQLQEKAAQGKNAVTAEELVEMSVRMLIGRLMQNAPEDKLTLLPVRVPAKIVRKDRDSFCFHIEELFEEKLTPNDPSSWKLAVTSQPSELTSENASKMLSNLPVKVSKEVADIIRLAVNYAQRKRGLAKNTEFRRIHLRTNTDPFNALYVGTLAPYSSQVIQLRQKHGNWQQDDETLDGDKFEFTEYVEAVKLVGDLHVPAGQIIFRAKTGRGCRLPHRGIYPEELGVVARYRGRGKVAEPGFKNPHWIDGELLILDGKGVGFLNGAQLCFVYSVPGQPYLILFKRAMIEG